MSKIQRSLNSLENICKKKLRIDENISVPNIIDFLNKKKIYNMDSLFLINFKGKKPISLDSNEINDHCFHNILGYKKIHGEDEYKIYCEILNFREKGEIFESFFEYKIIIANEQIVKRIILHPYKKLDYGVRVFLPLYNCIFIPFIKCYKKSAYRKIDFQ